jgi:hypothetical protein
MAAAVCEQIDRSGFGALVVIVLGVTAMLRSPRGSAPLGHDFCRRPDNLAMEPIVPARCRGERRSTALYNPPRRRARGARRRPERPAPAFTEHAGRPRARGPDERVIATSRLPTQRRPTWRRWSSWVVGHARARPGRLPPSILRDRREAHP